MTTTDLLNALLAKKGQDYYNEFSAFMAALISDNTSGVATSLANANAAAGSATSAAASANTAASLVTVKQPNETAGIDPAIDFVFSSSLALPAGVVQSSSAKYVFDRAGLLTSVAAGTCPVDFDPVTSVTRGLRVEEARTNLILGSDAPSTQSVSVTAQAYTLSFYGTGTVTLSGTYSATVAGTGAFPTQKTLTFTPTAGSLTLTISGTVQYAQLEAGSVATSYVKTVGSTVTRSADGNTLLLSSVPGWNASEGTIYVEAMAPSLSANFPIYASLNDGTSSNSISIYKIGSGSGSMICDVTVGGVFQCSLSLGAIAAGTKFKVAFAFKSGSFAASLNGASAVTSATGSIPSVTRLDIGSRAGALFANGYINRIALFPRAMPSTVQLLTA